MTEMELQKTGKRGNHERKRLRGERERTTVRERESIKFIFDTSEETLRWRLQFLTLVSW